MFYTALIYSIYIYQNVSKLFLYWILKPPIKWLWPQWPSAHLNLRTLLYRMSLPNTIIFKLYLLLINLSSCRANEKTDQFYEHVTCWLIFNYTMYHLCWSYHNSCTFNADELWRDYTTVNYPRLNNATG